MLVLKVKELQDEAASSHCEFLDTNSSLIEHVDSEAKLKTMRDLH